MPRTSRSNPAGVFVDHEYEARRAAITFGKSAGQKLAEMLTCNSRGGGFESVSAPVDVPIMKRKKLISKKELAMKQASEKKKASVKKRSRASENAPPPSQKKAKTAKTAKAAPKTPKAKAPSTPKAAKPGAKAAKARAGAKTAKAKRAA